MRKLILCLSLLCVVATQTYVMASTNTDGYTVSQDIYVQDVQTAPTPEKIAPEYKDFVFKSLSNPVEMQNADRDWIYGFTDDYACGLSLGLCLGLNPPNQGEITESYSYPAPSKYLFFGGDKSAGSWENTGFAPDGTESTNPPTLAADKWTFDGSNDVLSDQQGGTVSKVKETIWPNAAGGATDEGFTNTGLALDVKRDVWVVGNDGRTDNLADPQDCSIVIVSLDLTTNIKEYQFSFSSTTSIQGTAYDNTTDTYWFITQGATYQAMQLDPDYTPDGTDDDAIVNSFTADTNANGIAVNQNTGNIYILTTNGVVKEYEQDGTFVQTISSGFTGTGVDMLFYDPTYNMLYYTYGNSGSTGYMKAYSLDLNTFSSAIELTDVKAVEGVHIDFTNNKLYVGDDGYFHNGGSDNNVLIEYDWNASRVITQLYKAYTELELSFVGKLLSDTSDTEVIFVTSDPVHGYGLGIYKQGNTTDGIRVGVNDGSNGFESVDLELGTAWTTESIITLRLDIANKTATLYQGGVQQDTGSWTSDFTSLVYTTSFGIGDNYNGADDRALNFELKEMYLAAEILDDSTTDEINQAWATEHSLSWAGIEPVDSIPVNTVSPAITGTEAVGQTLTCSSGTWTGYPVPTYGYTWENENVDIGGVTSSTYTVQASDEGDTLTCEVTATNTSGAVAAESSATGTISAAFSPDDVSNLAIWLDASDASTITESSGSVSQWNDKSGNGRHVTQASGSAQPTTGTATQNSLNVLVFDGSDYMEGSAPFMYSAGEATIFVVTQGAAQSDNRVISEGSTSTTTPIYSVFATSNSGGKFKHYIRNDSSSAFLALDQAGTPFNNTPNIGLVTDEGSSITSYVNGGTGDTDSYTRSGTLTLDTFAVGALVRTSAGSFYNGKIAEIIIYTSTPTDSEINQVGNYLEDKWGITWTDI